MSKYGDLEEMGSFLQKSDELMMKAVEVASRSEHFAADMKASFAEFRGKIEEMPGFDSFKKFDEIKYEDGNVKIKSETEEVNLTQFRDKFNSGDFKGALDELGIKTDTAEARNFITARDAEFAQTNAGRFRDGFQEVKADAQDLGFPKEPETANEFKTLCEEKGINVVDAETGLEEVKKTGNDPKDPAVQEKAKNWLEKYGGKLKDWVKENWIKLVLIAALMLLAVDLYDFIKKVQKALSGCWSTMANSSTPPCKIQALTCDDDEITAPSGVDGFKLCQACQTPTCQGVGGGDWVPLRTAVVKSCDSTGKADLPGCYNYLAETGDTSCTTPFQDRCASGATGGTQYACPNTAGCIARKQACSGDLNKGDCSAWCDSSLLMPIAGQTISCKNCDFWCAANAAAGQIFSPALGIFGKIEKILLYIALGIVAVVIVYYIGKELLYWFVGRRRYYGGYNSYGGGTDVRVELATKNDTDITSAKTAFGRKRNRK